MDEKLSNLEEALLNVNVTKAEMASKFYEVISKLQEQTQAIMAMLSSVNKKIDKLLPTANEGTGIRDIFKTYSEVLTENHLEHFENNDEVSPKPENLQERPDTLGNSENGSVHSETNGQPQTAKEEGTIVKPGNNEENGELPVPVVKERKKLPNIENTKDKTKTIVPTATLAQNSTKNEPDTKIVPTEKPNQNDNSGDSEKEENKPEEAPEEDGAETLTVKDKRKIFEAEMKKSQEASRVDRAAAAKPRQDSKDVAAPSDTKAKPKYRKHRRSLSQPPIIARNQPTANSSESSAATTQTPTITEENQINTEPSQDHPLGTRILKSTEIIYKCSLCESVLPNWPLREDGVSVRCVTGGCGHRNIVGTLEEGNRWVFTPCRSDPVLPPKLHCQQVSLEADFKDSFRCQVCDHKNAPRDATTWIALT